ATQGGVGIAAGGGIEEAVEGGQGLAAGPGAAEGGCRLVVVGALAELGDAGSDGVAGQAGGGGDGGDTSVAQGKGFGGGPLASDSFVHHRLQGLKLGPQGRDRGGMHHATSIAEPGKDVKINLLNPMFRGPL